MKIKEITEGLAWQKTKTGPKTKFRCPAGPRKGRIVSSPAQCYAAPDVNKRAKLALTKAKWGKRLSKKVKRTKRMNPASILKQRLNKALGKK